MSVIRRISLQLCGPPIVDSGRLGLDPRPANDSAPYIRYGGIDLRSLSSLSPSGSKSQMLSFLARERKTGRLASTLRLPAGRDSVETGVKS